jgi:hypothetical protein
MREEFQIKCFVCGEISTTTANKNTSVSVSARSINCTLCKTRYRFKCCEGCEHHSYHPICSLQDILDVSKCPLGRWHRFGRSVFMWPVENAVDYDCPSCGKKVHMNKNGGVSFCGKCKKYIGQRGKLANHHRGEIPIEESRSKNACRLILKKHHEDMKNDPERLSTKFIADVAGCSCRVVKEKQEKPHA